MKNCQCLKLWKALFGLISRIDADADRLSPRWDKMKSNNDILYVKIYLSENKNHINYKG